MGLAQAHPNYIMREEGQRDRGRREEGQKCRGVEGGGREGGGGRKREEVYRKRVEGEEEEEEEEEERVRKWIWPCVKRRGGIVRSMSSEQKQRAVTVCVLMHTWTTSLTSGM